MNNEQPVNSSSHGLKWGLLISAVYLVLLFLRYYLGASSFLYFSLLTFVGYTVVLILLFFCGYFHRRDNGGWVEMKEVFKSMFIAVLVFEFVYILFTFVYLKYIDPGFFDKLRDNAETILASVKQPQSNADKILDNIDQMKEQSRNMGAFDFIRSYLTYVGITGLFSLLFAFILKRRPPVAREDNFYQS